MCESQKAGGAIQQGYATCITYLGTTAAERPGQTQLNVINESLG